MRVIVSISACFIILMACLSLNGYGQDRPDISPKSATPVADTVIKENIKNTKKLLKNAGSQVDSLAKNKIAKNSTGIRERASADSVSVTWENGKLTLPEKELSPSDMDLEEVSEDALHKISGQAGEIWKAPDPGMPDTFSIRKYNNIDKIRDTLQSLHARDKLEEQHHKLKQHTDSLNELTEKGKQLISEGMEGVPDARKIYSQKTLKRLYDSLGVSRLDSVLALAASKKEVSKEELLQAINFSFPSSPVGEPVDNPLDLAGMEELKSLQQDVPVTDLSAIELSPEITDELPPVGGLQVPSKYMDMLDSLRNLQLEKEKLELREEEITGDLKAVVAKKKPRFWDKAYFEGVIAYLEGDEMNLVQVSPALGYHLNDYFSLGLGPNVLISQKNNEWSTSVGYRSFAKYELFRQKAYLQVEDVMDPQAVNTEYFSRGRHSVLAGGGYLLPVSKVLAANFMILYRVNNDSYSGGQASPWVIRLGISSIKSKEKVK